MHKTGKQRIIEVLMQLQKPTILPFVIVVERSVGHAFDLLHEPLSWQAGRCFATKLNERGMGGLTGATENLCHDSIRL